MANCALLSQTIGDETNEVQGPEELKLVGRLKVSPSSGTLFSPDGETILVNDFAKISLYRWPAANGTSKLLVTKSIRPDLQLFLANSQKVISSPHGATKVIDLSSKAGAERELDKLGSGMKLLACSNNGDIACFQKEKMILVRHLDDGSTIGDLTDQVYPQTVTDAFFTDTGKQLMTLHSDRICLVDLGTMKTIETMKTETSSNVRFSRDGRYVVSSSTGATSAVQLLNVRTGQVRDIPDGKAYSADFNWVVKVKSSFTQGSYVELRSIIDSRVLRVPIEIRSDHFVKISHHPSESKFVLSSTFDDVMFFEYTVGPSVDIFSVDSP